MPDARRLETEMRNAAALRREIIKGECDSCNPVYNVCSVCPSHKVIAATREYQSALIRAKR